MTPRTSTLYSFAESPGRASHDELREINQRVRLGSERKRLFFDDDAAAATGAAATAAPVVAGGSGMPRMTYLSRPPAVFLIPQALSFLFRSRRRRGTAGQAAAAVVGYFAATPGTPRRGLVIIRGAAAGDGQAAIAL